MRRLPPAVVTDLPVLVALVLAWLTVAVFWAHLATGLLLIALITLHLYTRRRLPLRGARPRRRLAYGLFIVAAMAMAATGLLRWAEMPHEYAWHGGISYLVLGLVAVHLWSVRRALLARIRTHRRERDTTRKESMS
jgi:quinol-cytochrome oxidoreductase complex cytochrome b subunit